MSCRDGRGRLTLLSTHFGDVPRVNRDAALSLGLRYEGPGRARRPRPCNGASSDRQRERKAVRARRPVRVGASRTGA
jgi:hypothetical protein